ncbi:tyrosine-type recombinase/integrase [Methanosarcina sp. DH2]|jgi:integrase|uniref:site-specific integrase n=1 Tax=Methanosarcina sp. DH2 TaxID=2605639 RepID=UPI001E5D631A|nr:site-specific integrase [Methanosarcina sp. DH2]MCC4771841.1 tyrosine-type recombinase/integrase [Methanosarcina sp. DH2]
MRKFPEFKEPNTEIMNQYARYMSLIGKKDRTIFGDLWNLKPFFDYLGEKSAKEVTRQDMEDYILHRKQKVGPTTVHNGIISLRSFYKWAKMNGEYCLEDDLFKNIKTKQPKNNLPVDEVLLPEDILKMRDVANNQRDRALVMVLWDSAVRKGELLNINIGHVQFDKYGAVVIVNGKTGKRRVRLIDSVPDLQLYLNMHPLRNEPGEPLFITDRKYDGNYRRLNEQTVNNILNALAERAGLMKNVYPHAYRHGKLTWLSKQGFNEMELRIFAGWTKESNMPATYLHLSGADIEKKILQKSGVIEDKTEEKQKELRPIECPRCKTKNPVGAKYCSSCSMIIDQETAIKLDETEKIYSESLNTILRGKIDEIVKERVIEILKTIK